MKRATQFPFLSFIAISIFSLLLSASYIQATTWYVDGGVDSSSQYGLTWADAFKNLQNAISAAEADDIIFVKEGRYPLSASIEVDKAVHIYGGFPADVAYPEWDDRDPGLFETVLDGQYSVYNLLYITDNATIDGFTIRNADDGCVEEADGGGAYVFHASPTITDCIFMNNSVSGNGGALFINYSFAIIDNCTFTGNTANAGGGIYNHFSSPAIYNCVISSNTSNRLVDNGGGGIYNHFSSPKISNCIISKNNSNMHHDGGGGICNYSSSPIIKDCIISGNNARNGGGVYNQSSSPRITNCTFSGNSAVYGGGLDDSTSSSIVTNCTFSGNSARNCGGGVSNYESSSIITDCTFSGNSAVYGGGIYDSWESSSIITNCIIFGNRADNGGGLYNRYSSPSIANSILFGNTAIFGGGIYEYYPTVGARPLIANCSITGNSADRGGALFFEDQAKYLSAHFRIRNCIIWNNPTGDLLPSVDCSNTPSFTASHSNIDSDGYVGFNGNINADPLFVRNPDPGPDGEWGKGDDDYGDLRLRPLSPCIDAAKSVYAPGTDFDGNTRCDIGGIQNTGGGVYPYYDMGAYEFRTQADYDADGIADCEDNCPDQYNPDQNENDNDTYGAECDPCPDDPINDIDADGVCSNFDNCPFLYNPSQADIDADGVGHACDNDTIWYVDGDVETSGDGSSWDEAVRTIQEAVAAAMPGVEIWVKKGSYSSEEDAETVLVIDKALHLYGGFDGTEEKRGDRDWRQNTTIVDGWGVTRCFKLSADVSIDGFTIKNGYASHSGGGVYVSRASPLLSNCNFIGNSAQYGGGVLIEFHVVSTITNCVFLGNNALYKGGGIYITYSSPTITNCAFLGNKAARKGGGIYNNYYSSPIIAACYIIGNAAASGGGIYNDYTSPTITNCSISGNIAEKGGGIYCEESPSGRITHASIINCIIWRNSAGDLLPSITNFDNASIPVANSNIDSDGYVGINGNINTDPFFVRNPDPGSDGEWGTEDDDYGDLHLQPGSPCIDSGNSTVSTLTDTDFDGEPRIMDGNNDGVAAVDMGADEYSGNVIVSLMPPSVSDGDNSGTTPGGSGSGVTFQGVNDGDVFDDDITGYEQSGSPADEEMVLLGSDDDRSSSDKDSAAVKNYICNGLWPSLKNPWYFTHPAGVAVDTWGNLYVVDTGKHRILKFTAGGKFVMGWGSHGSGYGQFLYPTGIATDLYGNVYVADTDNHRIQKFDSNGNFISEICEQILDTETLSYPQGVTLDEWGNIYVTDTYNDRIVKFCPDGYLIAMWGAYGTSPGEFDLPRGIASDRQGHIYVADRYNHRIQKFGDNGTFLSEWGSDGDSDTQLDSPLGIAVGEGGSLYISDSENCRIIKLHDNGTGFGFVAQQGTCGDGSDEFCNPVGIAADGNRNLYVTDIWNNRIQKYVDNESDFLFVARLANRGENGGEFIAPESIAVGDDAVYVADTDNNRIQVFSGNGDFLWEWNYSNYLLRPMGIASDKQGYTHVANSGKNHLIDFKKANGYCKFWDGYGKFTYYAPRGIACDNKGNIYVVDSGNGHIVKKTNECESLVVWGGVGTDNGTFRNPHGIAVDAEGNAYVADTDNHRVQKFTSNGVYIGQWGIYGSGEGEFNAPRGVATDNESGRLVVYVADSGNHRIQKFTADGTFIQTFGGKGTNPGQLNDPGDLSIARDGRIYVADTGNDRIQVFSPLQKPNSKAIIVAGRTYAGDALWNATSMNTKFAYRALLYQGFTKDTICYLSSDIQWDQDNNGQFDDVDGEATRENLHKALTEWVQDADNLVVCLIDHGGPQTFRLNEQEVLSAGELSQWLDSYDGPTTVVYDACSSGSFLQALKKDNRTVIASTDVNQRAKFLGGGAISFSNYFWNHIFNGTPVKEAMAKAGSAIVSTFGDQTPMSEPADIPDSLTIGYGTSISGSAPEIAAVSPPAQTITSGTSATIRANGITDQDSSKLSGVWAVVLPPGFSEDSIDNPMVELPYFEMQEVDCDGYDGKCYEGTFDKFTIAGEYQVAVYAMDDQGNTSMPLVADVEVENNLAQRAIIVAGETAAEQFVEKGVGIALRALRIQGYKDEVITVLGMEEPASLSALQVALEDSRNSTHDLVMYLIGQGGAEEFQINASEILSAAVLDGWLDDLQGHMDGMLTVIYDADSSGSFMPRLTPPENRKRIVITSTAVDETVYYGSQGLISFSTFFWSQVYNGEKVHDAFTYAKKAAGCLNKSCRSQTPGLNDNGNEVANEYADGLLAMNYKIGIGWNFADDGPMIGSLFAEAVENKQVSIQAGVTGTGEIKRVWAVVTPSDYCPGGSSAVAEIELDYDSVSETAMGLFDAAASQNYKITVYARDNDNNTSQPFETKVYLGGSQRLCGGNNADAYEDDNSKDQAKVIVVNDREPQEHNFCSDVDEDWVKFYGLEGEYYSIAADDFGDNSKPVIELYNENLDMQRSKVPEEGGAVYLDWLCPEDAIYYVRLWNYLLYDEDSTSTGYRLRVYNPYWPDFLVMISGEVQDRKTQQPIDGAVIATDGGGAAISSQGRYELYQYPGQWTLSAMAAGYQWLMEQLSVGSTSLMMQKDISMQPLGTSTSTTTSIDSPSSPSGSPTTTTVPGETTSSSTTTTIDGGNPPTTTTTVLPQPPPLEITSIPRVTAFAGETYTYTVEVGGGSAVTCSLETAPAGMEIDNATNTITWTPTVQQLGNHKVVVCAVEDLGQKVSQEFTVRVTLSCMLTQVLNNNRHDLDMLRNYRDSRLYRSSSGRGLLYLYYANGPELYEILAKQPGLMASVRELVRELLPVLKRGVEKNEPVSLSRDTRREMRSLLKKIRQKASPGLKKGLALVLRRLEDGSFLKEIGVELEALKRER